jgi:hypothetical protein
LRIFFRRRLHEFLQVQAGTEGTRAACGEDHAIHIERFPNLAKDFPNALIQRQGQRVHGRAIDGDDGHAAGKFDLQVAGGSGAHGAGSVA